jgi:hypothetical protein
VRYTTATPARAVTDWPAGRSNVPSGLHTSAKCPFLAVQYINSDNLAERCAPARHSGRANRPLKRMLVHCRSYVSLKHPEAYQRVEHKPIEFANSLLYATLIFYTSTTQA